MSQKLDGRKAIVCASSRGLGKGCAIALAEAGATLIINGRDADALGATAEEIRTTTGREVKAVPGDVTTSEGRQRILDACSDPDIVVTNAGGPPAGNFRNWTREDWLKAIDANMLGPIELIRAVVDGMISRRFGRIVNITSSGVKSPIGVLGLSNGARAGLTGFVSGLARETVRHNVTINNLLPGAFDTDRRAAVIAVSAKASGRTEEQARHDLVASIPAGRLGTIEEFGAACAFLCSAEAGFITGQNLLLDGGEFTGSC